MTLSSVSSTLEVSFIAACNPVPVGRSRHGECPLVLMCLKVLAVIVPMTLTSTSSPLDFQSILLIAGIIGHQ